MQWMVKAVFHCWQSVQILLMSILGELDLLIPSTPISFFFPDDIIKIVEYVYVSSLGKTIIEDFIEEDFFSDSLQFK